MPDQPVENGAKALRECVTIVVTQFLDDMGSTPPKDLHERIMSEAERPLIEAVLKHTDGNQSRAAEILGMTRATLRKRIRRYAL